VAKKTKIKKVIMAKPKAKSKVKAKVKTQAKPKVKAKAKPKAIAKKTKSAAKKTKPVAKAAAKPVIKVQAAVKVKASDLKNFVTPLDDRIIVQVENEDRMTAGGLYIPDTIEDARTYFKGVILAVGRGHRDAKGRMRPMDVKVGDQVLFSSVSGAKISYQSVDLKIIRETDVMGVVNKD